MTPTPSGHKKEFAFGRTNFILLAIGMAIVIVGLILMSGSGSSEGTFDASIFDARRIKVAPVVCLVGYLFMIFAILFKKKDKDSNDAPRA
jgi:membrane-bound ClpP family serine protease